MSGLAECGLCIEQQVKNGLEPVQLIVLPRRTSKKKLAVKVCPVCDSADILKGASYES